MRPEERSTRGESCAAVDISYWTLLFALGACAQHPRSPADRVLERCPFDEQDGYPFECRHLVESLDATGLRELRADEDGERLLFYSATDSGPHGRTLRAVALKRPPSEALQRWLFEHDGPYVSIALLCRRGCDILRAGLERSLRDSMQSDFNEARFAAAGLGFIGDSRARPVLRRALEQKRSWSLTIVAARALGILAMPRAAPRQDLALVARHWSGTCVVKPAISSGTCHLVGAKVLLDGSLVAVASGGVVRVDRRGVWGIDCSTEKSQNPK